MEVATESAKAIGRASQNPSEKAMLDASCKQVLSIKGVLAWILKSCVPEFKDVDVKAIENRCIEGEPQVGVVGVYPDETNAMPVKESEILEGMNTEDTTVTEGKVTYDIRFKAIARFPGN